jgi:hypothetical protein
MKLSATKIDPALSEQGDWVENIHDLPGIRIKARGTNNSDYRALEAKLVREIPRAERIEGVSPKEQDRIVGDRGARRRGLRERRRGDERFGGFYDRRQDSRSSSTDMANQIVRAIEQVIIKLTIVEPLMVADSLSTGPGRRMLSEQYGVKPFTGQ